MDEQKRGRETSQLKKFSKSYEAESASIGACQSALEWIQWMFDLCKQDPSKEFSGIHTTLAWPLVISDRYIEALHQRRPEAFAVLAFHAVTSISAVLGVWGIWIISSPSDIDSHWLLLA